MRKFVASSLLFGLLTSASLSAFSAEQSAAASVPANPPVVQQVQAPESAVVLIDLNTADAATLEHELKGIGEVKAKAIVAYREANGPFTSVEELLEVKGIGSATLEKNRDKLTVN